MSLHVAEAPVLRCAILGALNNTIICVVPTRPVAHLPGLREDEHFHGTQFEVVNADGLFFTTQDLERMGLHPSDAFGIRDFCEDKLPLIHAIYFPDCMYDKVFIPGCCHIDDAGNVRILFLVSGSTQ